MTMYMWNGLKIKITIFRYLLMVWEMSHLINLHPTLLSNWITDCGKETGCRRSATPEWAVSCCLHPSHLVAQTYLFLWLTSCLYILLFLSLVVNGTLGRSLLQHLFSDPFLPSCTDWNLWPLTLDISLTNLRAHFNDQINRYRCL